MQVQPKYIFCFLNPYSIFIARGPCKSSRKSVVRMAGWRRRIEMEFMLTTGYWLLTSRKTAKFCK